MMSFLMLIQIYKMNLGLKTREKKLKNDKIFNKSNFRRKKILIQIINARLISNFQKIKKHENS
jgi:hypothetical protein